MGSLEFFGSTVEDSTAAEVAVAEVVGSIVEFPWLTVSLPVKGKLRPVMVRLFLAAAAAVVAAAAVAAVIAAAAEFDVVETAAVVAVETASAAASAAAAVAVAAAAAVAVGSYKDSSLVDP